MPSVSLGQANVLSAIRSIGEAFLANPRLDAVADRILTSAVEVSGGDGASLMLLSDDGATLTVRAAVGPRAHELIGTHQRADESLAGATLAAGQPRVTRGPALESQSAASRVRSQAWSIVLPLRVVDRLLGVLNVSRSTADELSADRTEMLGILTNQAAFMLDVVRLYQDVARKERRLEMFVDRLLRGHAETTNGANGKHAAGSGAQATPPIRTASTPRGDSDARLSVREIEVLRLIVDGRTNKEIAARLYLSPDTVKNHVVHIIQKLRVADRTQAAVVAVREGLLD
ncbi:MAG: LuxR C-terminal-related transcriptional regulator [Chloroflexota bacterium]